MKQSQAPDGRGDEMKHDKADLHTDRNLGHLENGDSLHYVMSTKDNAEEEEQEEEEAFVTMVLDDDMAIGAEVMLHSLREHSRIWRPQVVMVTSGVSYAGRQMLEAVTDNMIEVRIIVLVVLLLLS